MAYLSQPYASPLGGSDKRQPLKRKTWEAAFCYGAFALSFGFSIAIVFGLIR